MRIFRWIWALLQWLNGHVVHILSWLALPVLVFVLTQSYLDPSTNPTHQLILLGLLLVAAILAQSANELLRRLAKVGPIEFVEQREAAEQRFEAFDAEYEELELASTGSASRLLNLHADHKLSERLLWEYEKADLFVTLLQLSGFEVETAKSEKFHHLLFRMGEIDLRQEKYVRAADRLELLLRISDGKFMSAETHYRCGLAYRFWAQNSQGGERNGCFLKARDHFRKSVKEDPHHWQALFSLAYVQVDLKMYELARQNNEKAIEIRPDFAAAKYNRAICYVMLKNLEAALEALKDINPDDMLVERVIATAREDPELKPLLDDEKHGQEAKRVIQSFGKPKS